MGLEINLQFTANTVQELREQLTTALNELNGNAVVKTPNEATKAEYQEEIAAKTAQAMVSKKQNLKRYTGVIFGWDVDEDDNLHPNWEEQDKLASMKEWYKELNSYSAVARKMTALGWKGKKGGTWSANLVKSSINNSLHERVGEFTRPPAKEVAKSELTPKKKVGSTKVQKARQCKNCNTKKTPQWRRTKAPEGPLCNACHIRLYRAAKAEEEKPKESSAQRSRRIRQEKIGAAATSKKKNKTKVKEPSFEPAEKVEADMSTEAFYLWAQSYLPGMVMRDKSFLVASKVIETWFTTLKPQSEYNSWLLENMQTFTDETRKMFEIYQKANPTILMIQDAGDNVVLMVNNPGALTLSKLEGLLE